MSKRQKIDRVGETGMNNQGYGMIIINYVTCKDCTVSFIDNMDVIIKTNYQEFKNGRLKNPYRVSFCGVGYIGFNRELYNKKAYVKWVSMINRCYNKKYIQEFKTYADCFVCDEWLNYSNFLQWFNKNYIEGFDLDKDILIKGNKLYSPETCCFVPKDINNLFTSRKNCRGEYPIGVVFSKRENYFIAQIRTKDGNKTYSSYNNTKDAFEKYKFEKESYIKITADKYKGKITEEVYKAMYNYQVEITD